MGVYTAHALPPLADDLIHRMSKLTGVCPFALSAR